MGEINKPQKIVVGLGEVLVDCFINKKNEIVKRLGGAPAIFAYHAAKSYCNGVIVSAVGQKDNGKLDKEGEFIIKELKNHNLSRKFIFPVKGKKTGTVEVDNANLEDPLYNIKTDVAWSDIPAGQQLDELAKETKAVYFGVLASFVKGSSKVTIDRFLDSVPDGCYKIFDVNIRKNPDKNGNYTEALYTPQLIEEYIKKCNVLKVNNEELEIICNMFGISGGDVEKCHTILNKYPHISILIVTMGRYGSSVYWHPYKNKHEEIAHSSLSMPVDLQNTVGAGDALAGAFIGELLRGKSIVASHQYAARRSEIVCMAKESMPEVSQYDIFVSYAHEDRGVVADIFCKMFESLGYSVWRDATNTECGDEFTEEIHQAIKNSEVVVLFSSQFSNDSEYVKQEIKCAVEYKKPIIPIQLDNTSYHRDIAPLLDTKDYLDLNRFISKLNDKINGKRRKQE